MKGFCVYISIQLNIFLQKNRCETWMFVSPAFLQCIKCGVQQIQRKEYLKTTRFIAWTVNVERIQLFNVLHDTELSSSYWESDCTPYVYLFLFNMIVSDVDI